MYHHFFNWSCMYGHLGCLQYFAIRNNAVVNNLACMYFLLLEVYFQGRFLEVGLLDKGYGHEYFSHILFSSPSERLYWFAFSPIIYECLFSPSSQQSVPYFKIKKKIKSYRWEMVHQCFPRFHFSDYECVWTLFHVFSGHFYNFLNVFFCVWEDFKEWI